MADFVINFTRKTITDGGKAGEDVALVVKGATPSSFTVDSEQSTGCSRFSVECVLGASERGKHSEVLGRS